MDAGCVSAGTGGEIVADITPIEANLPHKVSEVVYLRCLTRWISVRPVRTLLKALECPKCGALGFVIETGEDMEAR